MGLPVNYGALVVRESEHDAAVVPGKPRGERPVSKKTTSCSP